VSRIRESSRGLIGDGPLSRVANLHPKTPCRF